jgi:hypothetical protein
MATEEYQVGYEVGYQDGWNAAQKPFVGLTDEEAHQILHNMAGHMQVFGGEATTEQQLSGECLRFIFAEVAKLREKNGP